MNKRYIFFDFGVGRVALIGIGILCVSGLAACAHISPSPPSTLSLVAAATPSAKNHNTPQKPKATSARGQAAFAFQIPNAKVGPPLYVGRSIGRRSSVDSGIRASLRMLSRLIKAYDDRGFWKVYWEASPKRGSKIQKYSTSYATFEDDLSWNAESGDKKGDDLYHGAGVAQRDIFVVAGYSGTFKDIQKRLDNPYRHVTRRIGRQASLDHGSRACLSMLSRLTKAYPDAQTYVVAWSVRLKGHLVKTKTNYLRWEKSVNRYTFVVPETSSVSDEKLEAKLGPSLIDGVFDTDIHAIARHYGNVGDLQKRIHELITRSIGRRSSTDAGVRASLRMLSRLIKAYPNLTNGQTWTVDWEAPTNGNEIRKYSTSYDYFGNDILSCMGQGGDGYQFYYGTGVVEKDIHIVAQHSGTFNDIQKRLDAPHRHIIRTIGGRATVNDGNRASLRMLSRLVKAYPDAQTYAVPWSVVLKGHLITTQTDYFRWQKSVTRETFVVPDTLTIFHTKKFRVKLGTIFIDGVSDADIRAVARHSGSFEYLQKKNS